VKDRPILYQGEMVRSILADRKTQTRRVAKLTSNGHVKEVGGHRRWHPADPEAVLACPYGQPGDRLWVRESWAYHLYALSASNHELSGPWVYAADGSTQHRLCDRWRPSIHMPRAASRIMLEITGVRVERLQDISEADAIAEGVMACARRVVGLPGGCDSHLCGYRQLWAKINGKGSWAANPLVWVVEFKRVEGGAL
jgi:hypothetical protein